MGYYQAEVESKLNSSAWELALDITLNAPTTIDQVVITIEGEASHDSAFKTLINSHNLQQGKVLHHGEYESLKSAIMSLSVERGYFNGGLTKSKITIKDHYQQADITLHYQSGRRFDSVSHL